MLQEYASTSREVFRALSLSVDPLSALTMDSIRKEEREKRRMLEEMRIAEQETCCMPIIAKSPPLDTDKLVAAVLTADDDLYVDKRSEEHTSELQSRQYLV